MKKISLLERAFFLKKTALFSSLDLDLLLPIADKLGVVEYDAGEVIFAVNDPAHRLYLIHNGSVGINYPEKNMHFSLEVRELFGDEALFNDQPRSYSAVALTDSLLLTLSHTHLLAIISELPTIAVALLQAWSTAMPCRFPKES